MHIPASRRILRHAEQTGITGEQKEKADPPCRYRPSDNEITAPISLNSPMFNIQASRPVTSMQFPMPASPNPLLIQELVPSSCLPCRPSLINFPVVTSLLRRASILPSHPSHWHTALRSLSASSRPAFSFASAELSEKHRDNSVYHHGELSQDLPHPCRPCQSPLSLARVLICVLSSAYFRDCPGYGQAKKTLDVVRHCLQSLLAFVLSSAQLLPRRRLSWAPWRCTRYWISTSWLAGLIP
jgi:hypothetical protein